jgi:NADPH:quinone reductase-like Zn-dependent oxidoreductase
MICIARIKNSPFLEFCCPATDVRGRTIKTYHIDSSGSVDGIVLRSSETPQLGEGNPEAGANALNYRDLMVLKGGGRSPTKIGIVPLLDDAGEVAAIGEGVTRMEDW